MFQRLPGESLRFGAHLLLISLRSILAVGIVWNYGQGSTDFGRCENRPWKPLAILFYPFLVSFAHAFVWPEMSTVVQ
jgi:hypothetical protein